MTITRGASEDGDRPTKGPTNLPKQTMKEGMSYAITAGQAKGGVTSYEGEKGVHHLHTEMTNFPEAEKRCIQASLRSLNTVENILGRLSSSLQKYFGIRLEADTSMVDLSRNRLVLCMNSITQAQQIIRNPIILPSGQQLKFVHNEPKLWVMTLFKVPGHYDLNTHLRAFFDKFGTVYRIYRKTLNIRDQQLKGPNVIVQFSELTKVPPCKMIMDKTNTIQTMYTKPSVDMVHPEHANAFWEEYKKVTGEGPSKKPKPPHQITDSQVEMRETVMQKVPTQDIPGFTMVQRRSERNKTKTQRENNGEYQKTNKTTRSGSNGEYQTADANTQRENNGEYPTNTQRENNGEYPTTNRKLLTNTSRTNHHTYQKIFSPTVSTSQRGKASYPTRAGTRSTWISPRR